MRGQRFLAAAWTFPLALAQSPLVITVAVRTCSTISRPSSLVTILPTYSSLPNSGSGVPTFLSSMQPPPTPSSPVQSPGSSYLASSIPTNESVASNTQSFPPSGTIEPIPFPSYSSGDNFTSSEGNIYSYERDTSLSGTTIDNAASGLRRRQNVDPYNALMDCVQQCDDEPVCVALTLLGQSCLLYADVESTSYLLGAQAAFNLERFTGFVEGQEPTSPADSNPSSSVANGDDGSFTSPPVTTPYVSSAPSPLTTTESNLPSAKNPSTDDVFSTSSGLDVSESEVYSNPALSTDRATTFTPPPPTTSVLSTVLPVTLSIPSSLLEMSSFVPSSRGPALSSAVSSLPVSSLSESPLISETRSDLPPPPFYSTQTDSQASSTLEEVVSSKTSSSNEGSPTSVGMQASSTIDNVASSTAQTGVKTSATASPSEVAQASSELTLPTSSFLSIPQEYSTTSTSTNLADSSSNAAAFSVVSTEQSIPATPSSTVAVQTTSSSLSVPISTLKEASFSSSSSVEASSSSPPPVSTMLSSSSSSSRTSSSSSSSLRTSSSTSSSVPLAAPIRNNGKRGLCYTNDTLTKDYSLSGQNSRVSWGYNYYYQNNTSPDSTDFNPALTFVPLLFNDDPVLTSVWPAKAQRAIDLGADSLLGFNEPDLCYPGSACMTVNQSVVAWRNFMEPFAGKARLGAPAVTNGGPPMSLQWLGEFMGNCTDCTIDFVPLHWYSNVYAFSYLQYYVQLAYNVTQKPIWITEFGIDSSGGSDAQIQSFLQMALPWLDAVPYVERYAYFYDAPGYLVKEDGSGLSAQGQIYNSYTAPCPNWENTQGHC